VKPALLDVNLLTALFWPSHVHHEAAHRWFARRRGGPWATCPLTQLGFVRLVSNPAFSREALSPIDAVRLLAANIDHEYHAFWPDAIDLPKAVHTLPGMFQGVKQFNDAYLLALASHQRGVFATFDRGLESLAGKALARALELVPVRP
jgi:uncharacterized protein